MTFARGMTLLEMLVATALLALLMVGVSAVVASLGAEGLGMASPDGAEPLRDGEAVEAWGRLLRGDLLSAGKVSVSEAGELTLTGYGALDASACRRTHRPVVVRYRLEQIEAKRWLVRRQALLDVQTNRNVQRDLVCSGVARFALTAVDGDEDASARHRRWRLEVWTDEAGPPSHSFLLAGGEGRP